MTDGGGYTPLMYAAQEDNEKEVKISEFLIKKGANVNAKDEEGYTAADYANAEEHKKVEALLR